MIFALLHVPCLAVDLELGSSIRRSILPRPHVVSMHRASIGPTRNDHPISILERLLTILSPFYHVDNMASFHLPGDPYFPN